MEFDLFKKENEIISKAEKSLEEGGLSIVAKAEFKFLLDAYKKLSKNSKRLIRHSDQNEKMLREAKQEIADQKSELEQRQKELVQAEKMASLGQLVSGVAHELNTPLGILLTSASCLKGDTQNLQKKLADNKIKKSDFTRYMDNALEAANLMERHSYSAADLIKSFKAVSVDQHLDEVRTIKLKEYVSDVLKSLKPNMPSDKVTIEQGIAPDLDITTYPGPLTQVVTNLVFNAYKHGLSNGQIDGCIHIEAKDFEGELVLNISDTGRGIPPDIFEKIFDPFFTTARDSGGTGLGLHIVHNIVTSKLKGSITCQTNEQTCFTVKLPLVIN